MVIVMVASMKKGIQRKLRVGRKVVQLRETTRRAAPTLTANLRKIKGKPIQRTNRREAKKKKAQMTLAAKEQISRVPIRLKIKDPTTLHIKQIQERT